MENINTPAVQEQGKKWSKEQIQLIKNTVAKDATDDELAMFLSIASSTGLNPFLKEVWCIKMGSRAVITTSRDGYLKIANNNEHYKGMDSDVVYSNDKFMKTKNGVEHSYTANRGQIVGAYACVYRDDRDYPAYFFAPFSNYKKGGTWNEYPHAMIQKVAESMALKRAFSISGLVTEEEIGSEQDRKIQQVQTQENKQKAAETPQNYSSNERKIQLSQLYHRYLAVCGNQKDHVFNAMKKITGKDNSADYTHEDIKALFDDVIRREDEKMKQEIAARIEAEKAAGEILDVPAEDLPVDIEEQNVTTETISN